MILLTILDANSLSSAIITPFKIIFKYGFWLTLILLICIPVWNLLKNLLFDEKNAIITNTFVFYLLILILLVCFLFGFTKLIG